MIDFYAVLTKALDKAGALDGNQRDDVYGQVRQAMVRHLNEHRPPLPQAEIDERLGAFDEAIRRIEYEATHTLPAGSEPAGAQPRPAGRQPASGAGPSTMPPPRGIRRPPPAAPRAGPTPAPAPRTAPTATAGPIWAAPAIDLAWDEATSQWHDPSEAEVETVAKPAPPQRVEARIAERPAARPEAPARPVQALRAAEPLRSRRDPALVMPEAPDARIEPTLRAPAREEPPGTREPDMGTPLLGDRDEIAPDELPKIALGADEVAIGEATTRREHQARRTASKVFTWFLGVAAVAVLGWCAYVFVPIFFPQPPAPVVAGVETIVIFDGGDPLPFGSSGGSTARYQGGTDGGFMRVFSSPVGTVARATIGPGVADRLGGEVVTGVLGVRGTFGQPAPTMRIAYQRGSMIIGWHTVAVPSEFSDIRVSWTIPSGGPASGDYILIEPGIPGDGNAVDIRSVALEVQP